MNFQQALKKAREVGATYFVAEKETGRYIVCSTGDGKKVGGIVFRDKTKADVFCFKRNNSKTQTNIRDRIKRRLESLGKDWLVPPNWDDANYVYPTIFAEN